MSSAPTATPLVADGLRLIADRDRAIAALRDIEEKLIALGAGRYCVPVETGASPAPSAAVITVVAAVPASIGPASYSLQSKEAEDRARELAGESFPKLFDRTLFYRPTAGFADLTPKILTPAKSNKLLELCLVPGSPISGKRAHVRW